jgi:hypothetical protein
LNIEEIPEEINDYRKIFGKVPIEVDHDSIGPCPFSNSPTDDFDFYVVETSVSARSNLYL